MKQLHVHSSVILYSSHASDRQIIYFNWHTLSERTKNRWIRRIPIIAITRAIKSYASAHIIIYVATVCRLASSSPSIPNGKELPDHVLLWEMTTKPVNIRKIPINRQIYRLYYFIVYPPYILSPAEENSKIIQFYTTTRVDKLPEIWAEWEFSTLFQMKYFVPLLMQR